MLSTGERLAATAAVLLSAATVRAETDVRHCILGEWRGGRVEALGLVPAQAEPGRNLSLMARSLTLAIGEKRIEVTGAGRDADYAYGAEPAGRYRVRVDLEGPSDLPDPLLFEVIDAKTLRADLAPGHLIELTRLTDPPGGVRRSACTRAKREPNPAGLILGDWEYRHWERANGKPLPDDELELVPPLLGLTLAIDRFELRARLGEAVETAPYRAFPPTGTSTRVSSEATVFGGGYGEATTVTMERSNEKTLRVGLSKYPGFFLVLGPAETDAGGESAGAAAPKPQEVPARPAAETGLTAPEIPYRAECEPGTQVAGRAPPDGREQWCEKVLPDGTRVRHGWYIAWHPSGVKSEAGKFRDGKEHGVWLRWHENGQKRVQAEFRDGVQHGVLIRWDPEGRKQHYLLYRDGEAVTP